MKILAGHHGQRGDVALNLPAIEWLHRQGHTVDMPIHRQFADMLPLFANHPALNACVITDDYEHFPGEKDREMLSARGYEMVLNPMQAHFRDDWWQVMHQTSCVLADYTGHTLAEDDQQINLVKWFDVESWGNTIAFAPFAGYYNKNNPKTLSVERAQEIVDRLILAGFDVLQLGGPDEPKLHFTITLPESSRSYFDSVRAMLGCKALIHTDTGLGWVCSGYKHPQIGLYSHAYYGEEHVRNIQPKNPNGRYLSEDSVANISLDSLLNTATLMLSQ